ncbi:transcription factor Ouib isoform X1 [Drosophila miranda]|uniref:transcription factor Ouib isoform X1 n=2 Tax=Drosophila miranda TaxID=7229 RepID=UPI0007E72914|nr:transcription factor Ouib isoform X1 [Drosophila miranda]
MLINLCRVCGKSNICPKALPLFEPRNRKLLRYIYDLTGIRVSFSLLLCHSNSPHMVCFCCQMDIKTANVFRRQCIKVQQKWSPMEKKTEDQTPKIRRSVRCSRRRPVLHLPVEPLQIVDVVMKTENEFIQATTVNNEVDQLAWTSAEQVAIYTEASPDETDHDSSSSSDKDYSAQPKLQLHKCNLCGIVKNNKASLVRHEYTHTGERPHPCKECPKAFLSGNELRAHMLTQHTKEPPFPCRYCERKYFSSIGRKKHERVHTNERPFVCEQCGKAFTRGCIMKQHMLSHTGQRMFNCDICNRSFTLKKHLVTHYISNTHKRNAAAQKVVLPGGENCANNKQQKTEL